MTIILSSGFLLDIFSLGTLSCNSSHSPQLYILIILIQAECHILITVFADEKYVDVDDNFLRFLLPDYIFVVHVLSSDNLCNTCTQDEAYINSSRWPMLVGLGCCLHPHVSPQPYRCATDTESHVITLKVLNFWKFTSYCSLKPLWSGMGQVVPARTSPTPHPPSPPTVHQLSQLAL